jgi:hypothetical protein
VALAADGAQVRLTTPDLLEVTGVTPEQAGTIAARLAIPIFECVIQSATLEDVFFRLTAEPAPDHSRRPGDDCGHPR